MTTKTFIEKALRGTTRRTMFQSLVVRTQDDDITVYSYGPHYPLVKIINGKAFINTRGYSTTTARHISWAFSAAAAIVGNNCYHVPLEYASQLEPDTIQRDAMAERNRLLAEMDAKKRKDTQVYKWLQIQVDRMNDTIQAVYACNKADLSLW